MTVWKIYNNQDELIAITTDIVKIKLKTGWAKKFINWTPETEEEFNLLNKQ